MFGSTPPGASFVPAGDAVPADTGTIFGAEWKLVERQVGDGIALD